MRTLLACLIGLIVLDPAIASDPYKPDQIWEVSDHSQHHGGHWFHSVSGYHILHVDMIVYLKGMRSATDDKKLHQRLIRHSSIHKVNPHHRHQHIGIKLRPGGFVSNNWLQSQIEPLGMEILRVTRLRSASR